MRLALAMFTVTCASACNGCYDSCPVPTESELDALPDRLSEAGLFGAGSTAANEVLGDGVVAFEPAFALWSDGADKRRWIALPEGKKIDTSDVDAWNFPVGTKLWKEFVRDGVRVETRMITRVSDGDDVNAWVAAAYVWNDAQDDATLAADGQDDAHGTKHDVPSASQCLGCHDGRASFVLGFSAVQLANVDDDAPLTLADAVALEMFTDADALTRERLAVPGDARARTALGYLHANCSHCHNQERPERELRCFDPQNQLDMLLTKSALGPDAAVTDTHAFTTMVEPEHGAAMLRAGAPDDSPALHLMERRGEGGIDPEQMPPLGTERVDDDGVAAVRAWVESL
jgi:hypothetical protein